ncbi:TIGR03915 family putative DNA repair protein [Polaromonas sp.]|uniref:TIGR03915 family putative DNA repair protein n=1 Tax=Polaromonas sp. TaxID=1869339 RepID=UPI003BAC71A6
MGVMNDLLTNDLFPQALLPVTLQGPTDLEGFRRAARALLARQVLPEQVSWHSTGTTGMELTGDSSSMGVPAHHHSAFSDAPAVGVPPEFLTLCQSVVLHSDPNRFGLLYRILWRLAHEPGLRQDPLDADMVQARDMAQAVQGEIQKIKAFVYFRTVQDDTFRTHPESGLLHVAWLEPEHHVVETVAPFLARRFAQMRWAILTPECSIQWDGTQLRFGPGAQQSEVPQPNAGQQHWLSCYQRVFKPARQKLRAMKKGMPRRHWHNRPEPRLVANTPVTDSAEEGIIMIEDTPEMLLI